MGHLAGTGELFADVCGCLGDQLVAGNPARNRQPELRRYPQLHPPRKDLGWLFDVGQIDIGLVDRRLLDQRCLAQQYLHDLLGRLGIGGVVWLDDDDVGAQLPRLGRRRPRVDPIGTRCIRRRRNHATVVCTPPNDKHFAHQCGVASLFDRTKKRIEIDMHDSAHTHDSLLCWY